MTEKIVLITGSTDGIGKETALQLAKMGATVIMHGRNHHSGPQVKDEIIALSGNQNVEYINADLSVKAKIHNLADFVKTKFGRLDVLINNAGVFMKERVLNEDRLEMTFAVNHVAHYILTGLLLPCLKNSPQGRIVTVSSIAHRNAHLDFSNLQGETKFEPYNAYALSKLANVLFTFHLAVRLKDTAITSNTLHPGVITTKLLKAGFNMSGATLSEGAETSVYLASSPEVEKVTGKYFIKSRVSETSPVAKDEKMQKEFWEITERLSGYSYSLP